MKIVRQQRADVAAQGRKLREEVLVALRRFCALPSDDHYEAVAMWVMATHCLPAFDVAPRLVIRSDEKRSGKTRLMEIVGQLAYHPVMSSNMTEAVLFRVLTQERKPTMLIDEADAIFGSRIGDAKEGLRGVLNAGFSRTGKAHRASGPNNAVEAFSAFGMVALAGIGRLPDTIEDRAVIVPMKRRRSGIDHVDHYRISRDGPALAEISADLEAWGLDAVEHLKLSDPEMPVTDRAADTWQPLVAIADLLGADIGSILRHACVAMVTDAEANATLPTTSYQLVRDVKRVLDDQDGPFVGSTDLCGLVRDIPNSTWDRDGLTPNKLARLLKPYDIAPRPGASRDRRGYYRADFEGVFAKIETQDGSGQPAEGSNDE